MNIVHSLFQSDDEVRDLLRDFIVSRQSDGNYLERLVIVWNEKSVNGFDNQNIQHIFAVGIDRKNQVYIDCSKRLIYAKILASTLLRPIHAALLVVYQLSMIPIFKAINSACSKEITASEAFQRSFRSIADIVRIPLYELAMIVAGCAALLIAPFAPTTLYRFRELIGKIEKSMFYGVLHRYALTPCFQSWSLKGLVAHYGFVKQVDGWFPLSERLDTDYGNATNTLNSEFFTFDSASHQVFNYHRFAGRGLLLSDEQKRMFQKTVILRSLIHFERAHIRHLRHNESLSPDGAHRSLALAKIDQQEISRIQALWGASPFVPPTPLRQHPPVLWTGLESPSS